MWTTRNECLYEGKCLNNKEVIKWINHFIRETDGLEKKKLTSSKNVEEWKLSLESFVKINFDGAFCSTEGFSSSGIIVRNNQGVMLTSIVITHKEWLLLLPRKVWLASKR